MSKCFLCDARVPVSAMVNHCGRTVYSDRPIPGVVRQTGPRGLPEAIDAGIDLGKGTYLIGSWVQAPDGRYRPSPTGDYSAIVNGGYVQVMQSKYRQRVALCSPCFPGQGDLETEGDFLAYSLPPEIWKSQDDEDE